MSKAARTVLLWGRVGCLTACVSGLGWGEPLARAAAAPSDAANPDAIQVAGWPLPDIAGKQPALADGDDPVYGRQACPPLMRLNLSARHNEALLLRHVTASDDLRRWTFELRTGIYWWSGAPVTASDVARYTETELPALVKARGGGVWELPSVHAVVRGPTTVDVEFAAAPAFGPFVLSGAPFFRPTAAGSEPQAAYECAGLYRPQARPTGITLVATSGYHFRRPLPEIQLLNSDAVGKDKARLLALKLASTADVVPELRGLSAGPRCGRTIDLPVATMIVWNPSRRPTSDPAFRKALTQLIPRGLLTVTGTAALAELASAPLPRQHPGYNVAIPPRLFDIKSASASLTELGLKRRTPGSPREDGEGHAVRLSLATPPGGGGLAAKVIGDAFAAVGIGVQFRETQGAPDADVDGILATFTLDWPRASYLGNFHSRAVSPAPFWRLGDSDLDGKLDAYARSLTLAQPNFSLLTEIHRRLAEIEPATVLFQSKGCLEAGASLRLPKGNLNQKDPDWFRDLLF